MTTGTVAVEAKIELVEHASCYTDLFSTTGRSEYRALVKVIHPDVVGPAHPELLDRATAAMAKVVRMFTAGPTSTAPGPKRTSGFEWDLTLDGSPVMVATEATTVDDITTSYTATATKLGDAFEAHLRVVNQAGDNDLLEREKGSLADIYSSCKDGHRAYFPTLVGEATNDSGCRALLLTRPRGTISLREVRDAFPDGIHPKDAAWMFRRLLVGLGAAHEAGNVHGAVSLDSIRIHPAMHGLIITDWTASTPVGKQGVYIPTQAAPFVAPEVAKKAPLSGSADVYAAAKLLEALLGTQAADSPAMKGFIRGCTLTGPSSRPKHGWAAAQEFDDLIERAWGPRKFREFHWPPNNN